MLTVLSIAYPLAPVVPDSVGGAEQVLAWLDAALVEAGHRSIVIACEGSCVKGELISIPRAVGELTADVREKTWRHCRESIAAALARNRVDVVHMHGIDFVQYLPPPGAPVLVTLHLPPAWYVAEAYRLGRPRTYLQCVSRTQYAACPPSEMLLDVIENGVAGNGRAPAKKKNQAFAMGRICPEKGFHIALDACRGASVPMILAGDVYRYREHENYFRNEIKPRLEAGRRFIGPVAGETKHRLLAESRCVLIPSLAPETSSLVAMEALAHGTPVIAFASGALPEIVEDGKTGFIVNTEGEMSAAILDCGKIDPDACRRAAAERFSLARMTRQYLDLYRRLAAD